MIQPIIRKTLEANLLLPEYGLVTFTWGNVSSIDREKGLVAIKPSGVPYEGMEERHIVVVDLDGRVVSGTYRPSTDTATHLALYKAFPGIGGIVHTHSHWATIFAQAGLDLPAYGTTHADTFYGSVPCTRNMTREEIEGEYEANTGAVIIETFQERGLTADAIPAVLVADHGPFAWGRDAVEAVHHAVILEECARMAFHTRLLRPDKQPIDSFLLDRHYLRKHGRTATYGQG